MGKRKKGKEGLESIPGVGKSIAQDLRDLGIFQVNALKGQNPEELYQRFCHLRGCHIDRCLLYVFRCGVYFAEHETYDPELLKWWNWTDDKIKNKVEHDPVL